MSRNSEQTSSGDDGSSMLSMFLIIFWLCVVAFRSSQIRRQGDMPDLRVLPAPVPSVESGPPLYRRNSQQ
eukprot:8873418-Pyramimonas_sp.AAC.1